MSDELLLTRVELSEFRSFAHLSVDLPSEPGVLIVHGSNGLGKSSLFDALEWTLTNGIDHFRHAHGYEKFGSYLCRWRTEPGPTSAAMVFSDGSRMERRLASAQAKHTDTAGTVPNVAEFLRSPVWTRPITSIDRYLLLTHFLGQSTLSRLTHRAADEKFEMLKEAAQSADLDAFGSALHGKGTSSAARAFSRRITALDAEAAELRVQLEREAESFEAARVAGALEHPDALELARRIVGLLRRGLLTDLVLAPASADVTALGEAIEEAARAVRERREAVSGARLLQEERARQEALLAETTAAVGEAIREANDAGVAAEHANSKAGTLLKSQEAALAELNASRASRELLEELRQGLDGLDRLQRQRAVAERELTDAEEALAAIERSVRHARRVRQMADDIATDLFAAERDLAAGRAKVELLDRWLERERGIAGMRADLAALVDAHPGIDAVVVEATAAASSRSAAARLQGDVLRNLSEAVDATTSAVAVIATNLPDDACDCPVCATRFRSPDALRARAVSAAERFAPALLLQEEAHRAAVAEAEDAARALSAALDVQSRMRFLRFELRSNSEANDRLREDLGLSDFTGADGAHRLRSTLEAIIASLRTKAQRRRRWRDTLAASPANIGTAGEVALAERRNVAARTMDGFVSRRASVAAAIESDSAAWRARAARIFPDGVPTRTELGPAASSATERLRLAQQRFEAARNAARNQAIRVAALRERREAMTARSDRLLERQWEIRASLEALPARGLDVANLDTEFRSILTSETAISEASSLLRKLRDGLEAQLRQRGHRDMLERLRLAVDLPPNALRDLITSTATARMGERTAQANATRRAKEIARLASADIASEVLEFNTDYIQPLGELMKNVNRAIVRDKRVGIELTVRDRKVEQVASRTAEVPRGVGGVDPLLVHSEGQLAALAVGMLSAASLTYPWSRWRALILDDPLAQNDGIHAAAFADLMANLVVERRYQILLSTHDVAQAEFLRRKFDARRVPCAQLSLLGRGRDGVEWSFQPATGERPALAASA